MQTLMNLRVTLGNGQTNIQLQLIFWVKMLINYYQVRRETTHKQPLQRLINNSGYFITTLPTVENLPEILPPE